MARIVDLEQQTESWLQWRLGVIGGSDANIIASYFMGIDYPFGGFAGGEIYRLWATKVGRIPIKPPKPKQSFGDYIDPKEHGIKTEAKAREWYARETGLLATPAVVQHDILPHLGASLDGYSRDDGIAMEIKCPVEPWDHRAAKEGKIPDKYMAQVHHNWLVAGMPRFDFVSFYGGEGVIVPFTPDSKFMDELRTAEETFWSWVKAKEFPLPAGDIECDDKEFAALLESKWLAQKRVRQHEAAERAINLKLMRYLEKKGARRLTGCGARVSLKIQPPSTVKEFSKAEFLKMTVSHIGESEEGSDANE